MTLRVHAHLHLSNEVERFGLFNKISAFPFEEMINQIKQYDSGTCGFFFEIFFLLLLLNDLNILKNVDYTLLEGITISLIQQQQQKKLRH
jgi:hypothetical protein